MPRHDRPDRDGDDGDERSRVRSREEHDRKVELVERRERPRDCRLPEVEHQAVAGDGQTLLDPEHVQRRHEVRPDPHPEHHDGDSGTQQEEWNFLDRQPAKASPSPAKTRGDPPQRVEVQRQQGERQPHHDGLGEHGASEQSDGGPVPAGAQAGRRPPPVPHEVCVNPQEREQSGDEIAPLGDPGHRLDPQRMNREEQRSERCPQRQRHARAVDLSGCAPVT